MSASDKDAIERFCDALWLEDGLSANTLDAYRSDLEAISRWLAARAKTTVRATRADLLEYLSFCVAQQVSPRTTSRLLSSLRRFYGYLLREERIKTDPTTLIDSPKIGRSLPKSLSEAQVEKLLQSPDVERPLGLRDRAMLETLYAAGLRVSELVGLTLPQMSLSQGVVRVIGKSMAQSMRRQRGLNPRRACMAFEIVPKRLARHRAAARGGEHGIGGTPTHQRRPAV